MRISAIFRKIGRELIIKQSGPKLLRIYASTILFWCVNSLTVLLGWFATPIIGLIVRDMYFSHSIFSKIWARSSLACAVTRFKVEGLENIPKGTPVIFMPNHQSNLDWLVLWSAIPPPFRFVCKKELFKIPFFGVNLRYGGHFSLDREAKKIAYDTLLKVTEVAKNSSIIIFPEGTRSWDGNLREFKGGGVFVALKVGIPIIPVAISGTFNIMPRNTWIITPGKVNVQIGKPITYGKTEDLNMENYQVAVNKVKESIAAMLKV